MSLEIVILEDCADRQATMPACLADRFCHYPVRFFEAAAPMIAYLELNLKRAIAIALDHDLEFVQDDNSSLVDPGTGRDVADFLAEQTPVCPVVIHSTNSPAAVGMKMTLDEANWTTYRVVPFGDLEWVSEVWIQAMRQATVNTAAPETEPTHSN